MTASSHSKIRLVLASASPARLATLRAAGIEPDVIVSGVDETVDTGTTDTAGHALALARRKAEAVAADLRRTDTGRSGTGSSGTGWADKGRAGAGRSGGQGGLVATPTVILGCDSVLEFDGETLGKPGTAAEARRRWLRMRGRSGVLHTGHCVISAESGRIAQGTASTTVWFADVTDEEIEAYVATGEPLAVAGAFTVDGLGGAFVERVEGDHHNVVGVSLPLLRRLLRDLDIAWPELWNRSH
ncbi:Maf family protein [Actinopolymorpha singaporensis]|uniref:Nucleoside triphosphate pyrophosphatase n=1 Tax=Actinopolymorpha singaporensis TaxID=117157 RepID=A0A1H1SPJ1_9ACTN|nr:nucleoside triphosphate pyrophosphatase [Actinopolymorpha singaporensis]SDS49902.1 septum formation protein [Actinopolymorpha singaporensis]